MKRNPHPDLVREHLKRWRKRLTRALNEVAKLERTLVRAEARHPSDAATVLLRKRQQANVRQKAYLARRKEKTSEAPPVNHA